MAPDFAGYVTKAGLKCSDGRVITPEAFVHQDKTRVPLVWNHGHDDPKNLLGYVDLEVRHDGVYGRGYFNSSENANIAKEAVTHGDLTSMSIFANGLKQALIQGAKNVIHGAIREVSLVMAGANPGAKIDFINFAHGEDDPELFDEEAVIYTGLELMHSADAKPDETDETDDDDLEHADDQTTMQDVYNTLNADQKKLVAWMLAVQEEQGGDMAQSALDDDAEPKDIWDSMNAQQQELAHSMLDTAIEQTTAELSASVKDGPMGNVFDQAARSTAELRHAASLEAREKFTPADVQRMVEEARASKSTIKDVFLAHAGTYGIDNIDLLFPDAQLDSNGVTTIQRRTEWVANVLSKTKHTPFTRIKSISADLTPEAARARGYVKGNMKRDEVIRLLKRVTGPKTIYKKQKLDRDDILDITELDVVAWLKAEMRVMLDEEIARAVLIGDGRDADDPDKIDEQSIRPIAYDDDMYTDKVSLAANLTPDQLVDAVVRAQDNYKGTGTPTLYTTKRRLTDMLLVRSPGDGRRLYNTKADLAAAMLVDDIVAVEVMEQHPDLVGILVNLADYTIGADRGGEISMFDDFDIDFNQEKYLIETRISGALTKPKSAVALMVNAASIVTPQDPTYNNSTGVVTIPTVTGVVYKNKATNATLSPGAQPPLAVGASLIVLATPAQGYGLTHGANRQTEFYRTAS